MIAVDTNVLVRFLVDQPATQSADDAVQVASARALILGALEAGDSVYVSQVVLVETVWVLRRAYKVSKATVVRLVESLVVGDGLQLQGREHLARALAMYRTGRADLSDYLILALAEHAQATPVYTFDAAALRSAGFERPPAPAPARTSKRSRS